MSTIRCAVASSSSTNLPSGMIPALLTSTSSEPSRSSTWSRKPSNESRRVTSSSSASVSPPSSAAVCSASSRSRSPIATLAPLQHQRPRGRLADPAGAAGDRDDLAPERTRFACHPAPPPRVECRCTAAYRAVGTRRADRFRDARTTAAGEPTRARGDVEEPGARGCSTTSSQRAPRARPLPARPDQLRLRPRPRRSPTTRCRCCCRSTRSYGPIFSLRLLHAQVVFMLGPEANHYVTVSHPQQLPLARGQLRRPDPAARRRAADDRRRLPRPRPADHDARLPPRADRGRGRGDGRRDGPRRSSALRPGEVVDVYDWARNLAMRIAMRALLGLDPDDGGHGARGGRALRARARLLRHRLPPAAAARTALARGGG